MNILMQCQKIILSLCLIIVIYMISGCVQLKAKDMVSGDRQLERIDGALDFLNPEGKVLTSITIEIVESFSDQRKGLMDRISLPPNHGMLFIFTTTGMKSFWMRNTQISLDIFFIDEHRRIVHRVENTMPYSEKSIPSVKPVRYVLEVNSGFAEKYHITSGCSIQWQRSN